MLMLSSVLVDENTPLHVRNAAGLALKNALTARVRRLYGSPLSALLTQYYLAIVGKYTTK